MFSLIPHRKPLISFVKSRKAGLAGLFGPPRTHWHPILDPPDVQAGIAAQVHLIPSQINQLGRP
jgi:hypothetical protein